MYLNPGTIKIGLIEASDDLLNEIASGTEVASFSKQKRGLGIV
jgi:hypothetical protein